MGKKRIVTAGKNSEGAKKTSTASSKRKMDSGILCIQSTYNNTKVILTDAKGNAVAWSSSGSLGFKGAKKGTPFAAAKVGELLGDKALQMGMKSAEVVIRGVGAGRESVLRAFSAKGIEITRIADETPIPHNGPRPPKPRRI